MGDPRNHTGEDEAIREIFRQVKTIAVVGLSDKPHRDSWRVSSYLQGHGFRIIPVNPHIRSVLGEKSYSKLEEVPHPIDLVAIFRRIEEIPAIVESALGTNAPVIWMQVGLIDEESAARARVQGRNVVMDRCLMVDHMRLQSTRG